MSAKSDNAEATFLNGFNCSQSVLSPFCDDLQLDQDNALKLACGFGAGIGRRGDMCGAVSGGIMVLGARYGRDRTSDVSSTPTTYSKVNDFLDLFTEKHGTIECSSLIDNCNLSTPEGQKMFKERDFKNRICLPCVRNAVEIIETLL